MPYLTIAKWVGGVIAALLIAWGLYAGIIRPTTKPNPTTKQEATTIINHNYSTPHVSFGCMRFEVYERKKDVGIVSNPSTPVSTTVQTRGDGQTVQDVDEGLGNTSPAVYMVTNIP